MRSLASPCVACRLSAIGVCRLWSLSLKFYQHRCHRVPSGYQDGLSSRHLIRMVCHGLPSAGSRYKVQALLSAAFFIVSSHPLLNSHFFPTGILEFWSFCLSHLIWWFSLPSALLLFLLLRKVCLKRPIQFKHLQQEASQIANPWRSQFSGVSYFSRFGSLEGL